MKLPVSRIGSGLRNPKVCPLTRDAFWTMLVSGKGDRCHHLYSILLSERNGASEREVTL